MTKHSTAQHGRVKWQPPRGLKPRGSFLDRCCQCPCPCSEPLPTHATTRDPPTLAGKSGSVSSAAFPWVLMRTRFCLCLPRMESLLPLLLWKSCNQIPLAFKVRFSGDFPVLLLDPQDRKPDMGLRIFRTVGEFLGYYRSPVCGLPTQQVSAKLLGHARFFATLWTAARQVSLSITNSQSLFKLMCIKLVMKSNHLILCHHLLLLPSIFPSIRIFSKESVLRIR